VIAHIYLLTGLLGLLQYVEIIYLIYRQYYWLPVLLGVVTTAAAISLLLTLRTQRLKVMDLVNHCRLTPIIQAGWVRAVSSHTLVPGDVVVVQRGKAMCDMVLLQGACLVVESMLSGEVTLLHLRLHVCLPVCWSVCCPSVRLAVSLSIFPSVCQCLSDSLKC